MININNFNSDIFQTELNAQKVQETTESIVWSLTGHVIYLGIGGGLITAIAALIFAEMPILAVGLAVTSTFLIAKVLYDMESERSYSAQAAEINEFMEKIKEAVTNKFNDFRNCVSLPVHQTSINEKQNELEEAKREYESTLSTQKVQTENEAKMKLDEKEQEINDLKGSFEEAKRKLDINNLEWENKFHNESVRLNVEANEKVETLQKEVSQLKETIKTVSCNLENALKKNNELDSENADLDEENHELHNEKEQFKQKVDELTRELDKQDHLYLNYIDEINKSYGDNLILIKDFFRTLVDGLPEEFKSSNELINKIQTMLKSAQEETPKKLSEAFNQKRQPESSVKSKKKLQFDIEIEK